MLTSLRYTGPNTGLCLALLGAGLIANRWPQRGPAFAALAGLAALLVAACALLQPALGWSAGSIGSQHLLNADQASTVPGLWPGRLRPPAAAGFALAGLALLLLATRRASAVVVARPMAIVVTGLALPAVAEHIVGNALLDAPGYLMLPVPTALGLFTLGMGLTGACADGGAEHNPANCTDWQLFASGFAMFGVMSVVACLVGMGLAGRFMMRNFEEAWLASFEPRAELFRAALQRAQQEGDAALQGARAGVRSRSPLAEDAHDVFNADASPLAGLPLAPSRTLYWRDGWRLRTESVPGSGDRAVADIALHDEGLGQIPAAPRRRVGGTLVCVNGGAACLPAALDMTVALPALPGRGGLVTGFDRQGRRAVAAVVPVAGTGLTLVQKIDYAGFYGPLRRQLWAGVGGITLLVLAGALMLYLRSRPLVLGLLHARARLSALLENVPAAIFTFGTDGTISLANRTAGSMFGRSPDALVGMKLSALLPDGWQQLAAGDGAARQLHGVHRDGGTLALEAVSSAIDLDVDHQRIAIVQDVGERRSMEAALRQREASLAHAQRIAHIGSWELDVATGTYLWSDETYRIFELPVGSRPLTYDEVTALVHPDDRAHKLRIGQEAGAGRGDYDVTFRVMLPSGALKVIHSLALAETDADGATVRLRGTVQDLTEKAWADEQLRKQEEEYRALVENSPDVVLRFDRHLRCLYVNPALARARGLRRLLAYGQALDARVAPAATWLHALNRALWGGYTGVFEVAVEEDGERFHYQVQVVPEFRQHGVIATALATARDISAIRRGDEVLRASEQRLSGIAANTPGAVFQWVAPAQGKPGFTYVSEGVVWLFGETPAAVMASPGLLAAHLAPDELERFKASVARCAAAMRTLNWEGRASGAGGREIWINCRATPRRQDDALIWEGVMLNVTDSKRNEQQLTESRRLLRELSAHHEQVREAERKRVAREVHDELGQSLTALRLDVAMLRMQLEPASPALHERIQAIKDAVDRTIGIVRNVTSLLRPAALDLGLNAALEWQVSEFSTRTGIACRLRTGDDEVELDDARATALFRIVQESLTNVIKHAGASEVEVGLETNGGNLRVHVRDNGRGFRTHVQPRPGRFGLVGMRERVLMMGGRLDIDSEPGKGTCVSVVLPLTTQRGAPAPADSE